MSARPVTDDQIARALRAHLPEQAAPGLRDRVMDEAAATAQLRPFPSFLGALSDADPVSRRRNLLLVAALLVALALASTAAVGALRLLQQNPIEDLSLEPPADLPAFVLSSYERLPELPPVAFEWRDSDSTKGRVYVHQSGTVRFDRFTSADANQPFGTTIINDNHRISGVALVESEKVWVEEGHESIEDDPRVFLRRILAAGGAPGCELDRDSDEGASGAPATGWRYMGAEYVAGRPTHHVACVGEHGLDIDLWIDIDTRLILRTREPVTDDAGQPIRGQFGTTEVTEIAFGEQPEALFEPPEGIARISAEAYDEYICTRDVPNELVFELLGVGGSCPTPPEAEGTPPPTPTPTDRPSLAPRPSGPAGPLVWTPASVREDWPAPVRPEPAAGSSVQAIPLTYFDPVGDTGSAIDPWVDIRGVMGDTSIVHLKLVSSHPPAVDPDDQWIAYGVVTDEDRDGVADWRYGIDNTSPDAEGEPTSLFGRTRVWRTNLHTGRTDDKGILSEGFRGVWPNGSDANFEFGGTMDVAGKGLVEWGIELDMPFYTWASVIVNGRVVAADYAPDDGWLLATPDATSEGTDTTDGEAGGEHPPDVELQGTYELEDPFPVRLSMTVGDGWTAVGEHRFYHAGTLIRDEGRTGLRFVMVDANAEDRCVGRERAIDGRATVDDVVAFLEGLPLIDISKNIDGTLDGHRGRYLEFTRTAGEIDCGWGGLDGWPASSPSARDEHDRVWILDIDGDPLVIDAFSTSASESVWAELSQIVESIQIEP